MKKKVVMNLRLFDGGDGGQQTDAGGDKGGVSKSGGTFTYEQLDEIAMSRAKTAEETAVRNFLQKQGMSEEEANAAFQQYKDQKLKSKPDISSIEQERDDYKKQLEQMQNEKVLTSKGVRAEDLDYVMFKVSKMVDDKTDFAKAAEKFLKENPRYAGKGVYRAVMSTETEANGTGGSMNNSINDAIRAAARR
ncbi:MAG: hypothetical protein K2H52_14090 [Lachnospiraceae bacterium]|nr:hypothetical protein [Lachnospiraceae bacterium]MDE7285836.1 hypothetical protein [Lachnospiraceae bacterium]